MGMAQSIVITSNITLAAAVSLNLLKTTFTHWPLVTCLFLHFRFYSLVLQSRQMLVVCCHPVHAISINIHTKRAQFMNNKIVFQ